MKYKVKGLVFVGFAAAILSANAMAAGENIVTSKAYTDATYQAKSTALSVGNTGGIWTPADSEVTDGAASIPTTAAVKDYVDTAISNVTSASGESYELKSNKLSGASGSTIGGTAAGTGAGQDQTMYPSAAAVKEYVADQLAAQNALDDNEYQAKSGSLSIGNASGGWTAVDTTVSNNANSVPTSAAVKTYADSLIGGNVDSNNNATAPTGATIAAAIDGAIAQNNTDTAYSSTSPAMITVDSTNHTISAVAGTVATGQTGLVSGGQVADAIAAAQQTNATNYQEKSTDSYQVGGAGGTWETMTAGTYTTLTRDATTDPDNPTVKYDINAATTAAGVTTGATTIPTSGAVADAIAAATGNQNIPAKDTSVCTATYPCALVAEGNRLNWRVMAVSAGQLTPAGTCGNADDNCGDA